jgi:hypothetical protein
VRLVFGRADGRLKSVAAQGLNETGHISADDVTVDGGQRVTK